MAVSMALLLAPAGCTTESDDRSSSEAPRPLQPLVYTETPNRSPEAEAVRERRLMRELLQGSRADGGSWGHMESRSDHDSSTPTTPRELGRRLFRAIVSGSDRAWNSAFISPPRYARMVEVSLEDARSFVDDQQGRAMSVRRAFEVDKPSMAPSGGLASVFSFDRLKLGEPRTLEGDVARGDDQVAQYWHNRLIFTLERSDVELQVRIRKILEEPRDTGDAGASNNTPLGVASGMRLGPRLGVFLETGMHLKPKLLESTEYPIPLSVGNYWRYERSLADSSSSESPGGLDASRVTLKVRSIDRYGSRRLVGLRWSYNDADLTRRAEHWLITPRRIYLCGRSCRRHVDELQWLLSYLRRQTPIFRFPLSRGASWGKTGEADGEIFRVSEDWRRLELPAGAFFGALEIHGTGPLGPRVPFYGINELHRHVAPGTGVVRRSYGTAGGEYGRVVESLADFRLMTH